MKSLLCIVLLSLVALCAVNAQNLNFQNCFSDSGHTFQWSIDTTNGVKTLRARLIFSNGYNGWAAVGLRNGYRWSDPNSYDPNYESKPQEMGEVSKPSTIYAVHRAPSTDDHEFAEFNAFGNDVPVRIDADPILKNVFVRSDTSNKQLHFYFERPLVVTNPPNSRYYNFNESETEPCLMIAGSTSYSFEYWSKFDDNAQHSFARIYKLNLLKPSSLPGGSCGNVPALPAYRAPKQDSYVPPPPPADNHKSDAIKVNAHWLIVATIYFVGLIVSSMIFKF
ncbi:hypothetical protein ABK040_012266 [Willaertia magna]